jgi:hypothetical protein
VDRKLIVCLPVWAGDLDISMKLLRLWADMEDVFNPAIAIAIIARKDMNISDIPKESIEYAEKKFKIFTGKSNRDGVGWPSGCNALEIGAYEWFVESNRMSGGFDYPYMLIAESDTVPLRKGWANEIMNEAYDNNIKILGSYLRFPDSGCDHINGNCVLHKDAWKSNRQIWVCPSHYGWDAYIGQWAIAEGTPSRLIWQDYRLGAPDNPWKGDDYIFDVKFYKSSLSPFYGKPIYPALFHGIKGEFGLKAVRRRILNEKVQ